MTLKKTFKLTEEQAQEYKKLYLKGYSPRLAFRKVLNVDYDSGYAGQKHFKLRKKLGIPTRHELNQKTIRIPEDEAVKIARAKKQEVTIQQTIKNIELQIPKLKSALKKRKRQLIKVRKYLSKV